MYNVFVCLEGAGYIRIDVLGVGFDDMTSAEAIEAALRLMETKGAAYVVTPNPEIVMLCRENPALAEAVAGAAMVLPDGIGVIYGAKILGQPLFRKLAGIDFVQELFSHMARSGMSVFLLGAKPTIAEKAQVALVERYPGLVVAGVNDGYFDDDGAVVEKINDAQPDLLLCCLGSPKQELWMRENAPRLKVGLMAGLGGALDVFSGEVQRAPETWQKLGLEWLYRLKSEPSRIRRMANLPRFVLAVLGKRLRGGK